jgi:hypothetical protein
VSKQVGQFIWAADEGQDDRGDEFSSSGMEMLRSSVEEDLNQAVLIPDAVILSPSRCSGQTPGIGLFKKHVILSEAKDRPA